MIINNAKIALKLEGKSSATVPSMVTKAMLTGYTSETKSTDEKFYFKSRMLKRRNAGEKMNTIT